jgi:hypothetical protein
VGKRSDLHDKLLSICNNVYFQPPESLKLIYPCIKYKIEKLDSRYANDKKYSHLTRYQIMVIDRDPDSTLPSVVHELPFCNHDRNYISDGLNHSVFELYY